MGANNMPDIFHDISRKGILRIAHIRKTYKSSKFIIARVITASIIMSVGDSTNAATDMPFAIWVTNADAASCIADGASGIDGIIENIALMTENTTDMSHIVTILPTSSLLIEFYYGT
jgi:hypothetical protein